MGYQIAVRRSYLELINKKGICHLMDFSIPADQRVKIKESEMTDKFLKLTEELKKTQWNMKVTMATVLVA